MGTKKKQKYLANRELSWLKFNERVLEEAADTSVPLCERMSFLSIFQSNLDEFFMVRVGSLYDQMLVDKNAADNKTGMTNREQLQAIFAASKILSNQKDRIYQACMEDLKREGVEWVRFSDMQIEDKVYLEKYFKDSLMPLLSPQVIGKNSDKLGIIPCSNDLFKRIIELPSAKKRYILVEEVILHYLPKVFENVCVR